MFYVYVHYKADTKEPFYVGKGTKNRATITYRRSSFWNNIANKHGFYHEIAKTFLTEEEAFQHEKELIAELSKNYKLANLTAGGEGHAGFSPTKETRNKLSKAFKGRTHSPEARQKLSESNSNQKRSPETCKRIGESKRGALHPFFGKKRPNLYTAEVLSKVTGPNNHNFKGYVYGLSETNLVVFQGPNDMNSRTSLKFNSGAVYQQLKVSQHKGFKFYRTKDLASIPRDLPSLDKETEAYLNEV